MKNNQLKYYKTWFLLLIAVWISAPLVLAEDASTMINTPGGVFTIDDSVLLTVIDEEQISRAQAYQIFAANSEDQLVERPDDPLTNAELAELLAKLDSSIPLSISARVFKSPDSYFRDVKYIRIFNPEARPSDYVNGRQLIRIISRYEQWREGIL
ncbi:hypothetical protein [Salinispira pacifica]|uniref:Uncharacterized protein n=1 Tax=Salinispira pacifica TaxID=1307761 RepID=V5WJN8_9SPIO|nr:hypothetical protein [Salinispira pacifica]AHC15865.1 hypothetical protein L21SP2_2513 [Salinispira pacifica]